MDHLNGNWHKGPTGCLQFVFQLGNMWSPHMKWVLVEVTCFMRKQQLCCDLNTHLLCRTITFGGLLGIDTFDIWLLCTRRFRRKEHDYSDDLITNIQIFDMSLHKQMKSKYHLQQLQQRGEISWAVSACEFMFCVMYCGGFSFFWMMLLIIGVLRTQSSRGNYSHTARQHTYLGLFFVWTFHKQTLPPKVSNDRRAPQAYITARPSERAHTLTLRNRMPANDKTWSNDPRFESAGFLQLRGREFHADVWPGPGLRGRGRRPAEVTLLLHAGGQQELRPGDPDGGDLHEASLQVC